MKRLIFIPLLAAFTFCKKSDTVTPNTHISDIQSFDSVFFYNGPDFDSIFIYKNKSASGVWMKKYGIDKYSNSVNYWYGIGSNPETEFTIPDGQDISSDTITIAGHYNRKGHLVRY